MRALLATLFLSSLAAALPSGQHDPLVISTSSGRVKGKVDTNLPNVRQFLGIPYAAPPVGDLRWEPPQDLAQHDATIQATELPPSCMQYLGTAPSLYTRDVLQYNLQGLNRTGDVSEDCLTLSIWVPGKQHDGGCEESLPVIIFGK